MKFCLVALAVITVAHVAAAGVEKQESSSNKPAAVTSFKQTVMVVEKGIVKAYCWRKRLKIRITPTQYLEYYFDKTKSKKGYMPRAALQKALIEAIPDSGKDVKEQLESIATKYLRKLKKKIDSDEDRKVTKEEFVKFFLPVISKDDVCGGGESSATATLHSEMYGRTLNTIIRGFTRIYCRYRKTHHTSTSVKTFLKGYYKKYRTKEEGLPLSALRNKLRSALPKSDKTLRKRLARLSSKFVAKLREKMDQNNNSRVSWKEFRLFFDSKLSKKGLCQEARRNRDLQRYEKTVIVVSRGFARIYCRDKVKNKSLKATTFLRSYFAKNKDGKDSLPKSALRDTLKHSQPRTAKHLRNRLARLKTKFISKLRQEIDSNHDSSISVDEFEAFFAPRLKKGVCHREHERRHTRRYRRTVRIIRNAFVRLYNFRRRTDYLLKPRTFLVNYFTEFKDENNWLPRQGLRTYLMQSLPKSAKKLKKTLGELRTYYIKKLQDRVDIDKSGNISRREFVKFLIEYLYRRRGRSRGEKPAIQPIQPKSTVKQTQAQQTTLTVRCNMRMTSFVVRRGLQRLYCIMKERGEVSGPRPFLEYYFGKYRNTENSLPEDALQSLLREALPPYARKMRQRLGSLMKQCVGLLGRSIDRNRDGRVSRREFVQFYEGHLSQKGVCLRGGRGLPLCKPGYVRPGSKGSRKCNVRKTTRVITRGFVRLYCSKKRDQKELSPEKFLILYFRAFRTRTNTLPGSALQKSLLKSLPKTARRLQKKLSKLGKICVGKVKGAVDSDGNFKISEKEFLKFFLPRLSRPGICRTGRRFGGGVKKGH